VLVLPVEIGEQLTEPLEIREGDRRLVHRRAAAPRRRHLAMHDQRFAVELEPPLGEQLRDTRGERAREPELALDDRRLGTLTHRIGVRALANQQAHGLDEQRFPRAGFPSDRVEARAERDFGALDDREIANGQSFEHR
jgi:hypothetical protein